MRQIETKDHFDVIAERYDSEIPEHIRLHLLKKKTDAMLAHLPRLGGGQKNGLDCGCGTGHYLMKMSRHGYQMSGFEYSSGMLGQAQKNNADIQDRLTLGSITDIPHPDSAFDFCYTINVLHHLPSKEAQIDAVKEMLRVTRTGGMVFLHDFDADNILARLYMDYIFPLTSKIDDDETEIWVSPKEFTTLGFNRSTIRQIDRFTLLPNFTPKFGFALFKSIESLGETIFRRRFGGHFMIAMEKT